MAVEMTTASNDKELLLSENETKIFILYRLGVGHPSLWIYRARSCSGYEIRHAGQDCGCAFK